MGGLLKTYVGLGFAVFPVDGKLPLTRHGFKDAVRTLEDVARLWDGKSGAGVGVATGNMSGNLLVVDIDERHGGEDSLVDLKRELGGLPPTVCCTTPSGGQHFYFRLPKSVSVRSSVAFRPGIDIRADGGYVVAPPSVGYAWDVGPDDCPIADAPSALVEMLVAKLHRDTDGTVWDRGNFILPERIEAGGRDNTLTKFAGQLRRGGLDAETIFSLLQAMNQERCVPPLENKDLKRIARSIGNKPITVEQAQNLVDKVVEAGDDGAPIPGFYDKAAIQAELARYNKLEIVTTGFPLLDKYLGGGLWSTQTAVLIAPTGSGKTTLAMQIARKVCQRRPVLVWTMEMEPTVLAARVAAQESGDSYLDILLDADVRLRNVPHMPEHLRYYSGRKLEHVVLAAKRVQTEHDGKPPLVVIDYMQKAPAQGEDPRQRLSLISETLRALALKIDCPILAISSASRVGATMLREAHKHSPAELAQTGKESGDIEYDASAVITLGLLPDDGEGGEWRKGILTVAKARFGPREIHLSYEFNGRRGLWREMGEWKEDQPVPQEVVILANEMAGDEAAVLAELEELRVARSKSFLAGSVGGVRRTRAFGAIDRLIARGAIIVLPTGALTLGKEEAE